MAQPQVWCSTESAGTWVAYALRDEEYQDGLSRAPKPLRQPWRQVSPSERSRLLWRLADETASGEWVDLPGIGKIQVIQEEANCVLTSFGKDGRRVIRRGACF